MKKYEGDFGDIPGQNIEGELGIFEPSMNIHINE